MPEEIAQALSEREVTPPAGAVFSHQGRCQGARHHSPTPLTLHQVTLCDGQEVLLCGTCEDNLNVFRTLSDSGPLPWKVRRSFGNIIRALANGGEVDGGSPESS